MAEVAYESLAAVYEWLVGDAKTTPTRSVQAFGPVTADLVPGARVLDCSCGIGLLAVGLAEAGFQVTACDASPEMVERTRALAHAHGVELTAEVCRWDQLPDRPWKEQFDAVFCVGNSLAHAVGRAGRLAALRGMGAVLRDGGVLTLTSRSWEHVRSAGTRQELWDRIVERDGRRAVVAYSWQVPASWDDEHRLEISVGQLRSGERLEVTSEVLSLWPFPHEDLHADLAATDLNPTNCTYDASPADYVVTARRLPRAAATPPTAAGRSPDPGPRP